MSLEKKTHSLYFIHLEIKVPFKNEYNKNFKQLAKLTMNTKLTKIIFKIYAQFLT